MKAILLLASRNSRLWPERSVSTPAGSTSRPRCIDGVERLAQRVARRQIGRMVIERSWLKRRSSLGATVSVERHDVGKLHHLARGVRTNMRDEVVGRGALGWRRAGR